MASRKGQARTWVRHDLTSHPLAVCLDGSPGVFYTSVRGKATQWLIFLEGGGWCYSLADCIARTATSTGSSSSYPPGKTFRWALMDGCSFSELCGYSFAYLKYCDGASFAGHVVGAVGMNGRKTSVPVRTHNRSTNKSSETMVSVPLAVRFRGRAILRAAIHELLGMGLRKAQDVLLSGCSAGGMAALLGAEAVHGMLQHAGAAPARFGLFIMSGLFFPGLDPSVGDVSPWAEQMRSVMTLANMTLPSACGELPATERYTCMLGTAALDAAPFPTFVEQSSLDQWQTGCVLGAGPTPFYRVNCSTGPWAKCLPVVTPALPSKSSAECPRQLLHRLGRWQHSVNQSVATSTTLGRAGSATFLHSCHSHCLSRSDWKQTSIGGTTLGAALKAWWAAPANTPAAVHTHHATCLPRWGRGATTGDNDGPRCPPPRCSSSKGGSGAPPAIFLKAATKVTAALAAQR